MESIKLTKQVAGHLQLPWRKKAGIAGYISTHSCVDFVPYLGQQHPVLRSVGNFFNISSIHCITKGIITHDFVNAREVFLVHRRRMEYNEGKVGERI